MVTVSMGMLHVIQDRNIVPHEMLKLKDICGHGKCLNGHGTCIILRGKCPTRHGKCPVVQDMIKVSHNMFLKYLPGHGVPRTW
jgi:hypothetical protein